MREPGKLFSSEHVRENRLKFGNNENKQKAHDHHRDEQNNRRIEHRRDDLVFDLLRFFLELREAQKNDLQHAAEFARFHHVHIELVENLRMPGERLGESAAGLNRLRDADDGFFENRIGLLLGKNGEAAKQWQPGIDQRGQLPREDHERPGLDGLLFKERDVDIEFDLFFQRAAPSTSGLNCFRLRFSTLALLAQAFGEIPRLPQLGNGVVLRFGVENARGFLTASIKGDVVVTRHRGALVSVGI